MCTVTVDDSLAVPPNDGFVLLDRAGGALSVTVGGSVSIRKVRGSLDPVGFPSELSCVARAVYCPLGSAGLAGSDVQAPPLPPAAALATGEPFALDPA